MMATAAPPSLHRILGARHLKKQIWNDILIANEAITYPLLPDPAPTTRGIAPPIVGTGSHHSTRLSAYNPFSRAA